MCKIRNILFVCLLCFILIIDAAPGKPTGEGALFPLKSYIFPSFAPKYILLLLLMIGMD